MRSVKGVCLKRIVLETAEEMKHWKGKRLAIVQTRKDSAGRQKRREDQTASEACKNDASKEKKREKRKERQAEAFAQASLGSGAER
jgi:peptidoglycan hydrolase CwlO-like protein